MSSITGPGPSLPVGLRIAQRERVATRPERPAAAAISAADVGVGGSIVLRETLTTHEASCAAPAGSAAPPPSRAGSARLAALHDTAVARGAVVTHGELRSPINLAINYYDGGHDFDVADTVWLTFDSITAVGGFLAQEHAMLEAWLEGGHGRSAELRVGSAGIGLTDRAGIELLAVVLSGGPRVDRPAVGRADAGPHA